jgi:tRNA pseudouridine38-40 synthase
MRYFIYLSYKGTNYHGWQVQPNGISVQEKLQDALSTILQSKTEVVGAGRTDAGVHARQMVAHTDIEKSITNTSDLVYKLNSFLPTDIAIQKIVPVKDDAHARFDAISRTYEYWLTTAKDPFLTDAAMRAYGNIDFEAMNKAAQKLFDYTDFTSFSKLHTDAKTNNCRILKAIWEKRDENLWVFTIQADRFLRNMVRAIVGTLLEVGRGQLTVEDFCCIIEAKDRCKAGVSVPAQGLYLIEVTYSE